MSKKLPSKLYLTTQDIPGLAPQSRYLRLTPAAAKSLGSAVQRPTAQALALAGPLASRAILPSPEAIKAAVKALSKPETLKNPKSPQKPKTPPKSKTL